MCFSVLVFQVIKELSKFITGRILIKWHNRLQWKMKIISVAKTTAEDNGYTIITLIRQLKDDLFTIYQ